MARWRGRLLVGVTALLGAVPVALLAVCTAWLLSNQDDTAPRARPAALLLSAPTLPDEKNAFFALLGLSAEASRDAASAGQALWQVNMQRAALTPRERVDATEHADLNRRDEAALGELLPEVTGAPLFCEASTDGCVAAWLAQPEALAVQRQQMAVLGARCDALFSPGTGFEERLAMPLSHAANLAPHTLGATRCSLWWRSGAVMAWQQGRPQQALAKLQQAARLNLAVLVGGQSLISNVVSISMTRDTLATAVALALRDAVLAPQLAPLWVHVTDDVLVAAARRWMAHEAAFQQTITDELAQCMDPALGLPQLSSEWTQRPLQALERWQCRNRVGFMPGRIKALSDDHWASSVEALEGGLPAAIAHADRQVALAAQSGLPWRNTIGHILYVVALPAYADYLRRGADLSLHAEAATLVVAAVAEDVPAAERAAWAGRQPMSTALRGRLRWDDSAQGFTVRTWFGEGRNEPIEPRRAIRFTWPAPQQG